MVVATRPRLREVDRLLALAVVEFIVDVGYPPSHRQLADGLGLSTSVVASHLRVLERAGVLDLGRETARAVTIADGAAAGIVDGRAWVGRLLWTA